MISFGSFGSGVLYRYLLIGESVLCCSIMYNFARSDI